MPNLNSENLISFNAPNDAGRCGLVDLQASASGLTISGSETRARSSSMRHGRNNLIGSPGTPNKKMKDMTRQVGSNDSLYISPSSAGLQEAWNQSTPFPISPMHSLAALDSGYSQKIAEHFMLDFGGNRGVTASPYSNKNQVSPRNKIILPSLDCCPISSLVRFEFSAISRSPVSILSSHSDQNIDDDEKKWARPKAAIAYNDVQFEILPSSKHSRLAVRPMFRCTSRSQLLGESPIDLNDEVPHLRLDLGSTTCSQSIYSSTDIFGNEILLLESTIPFNLV